MRLDVYVLLAAIAACSHVRPHASEPAATTDAGVCFRVSGETPLGVEVGSICAETIATCERIRRGAIRYGGLAALREVGECAAR